ncbi:MAG: GNAT family N-acetyltransferase [Anaerolineaceae bacterium]|nr:GNAT family N-acetyltransferase [Anaerolineaceae bacterium]
MAFMTLTVQQAVEFPLTTLCDVINRSFKGYVAGDIQFTPPILAGFIANSGIHLGRSLVALQDNEPAGIAMLARRGWSVRIALMGVVPEIQNQGVGRWLLAQIASEAKTNGDRTVILEVIEQNPRAVHLYESCGYRSIRRLMGYDYKASGQVQQNNQANSFEQVDISEAARHITAWESADLPWQCSGISAAKFGAPNVAYRINGCYAICSKLEAETISLLGLAVRPDQQRKGIATQLVANLITAYPGKQWHIAPICPEEYGAIFLGNGFTVNPLNQFQMELRL